jgi:formylglycine-generating enzyme required for sulfatase activity
VPIGPDAASGLWEFWDVATGVEPERGPDGALVLTEEMGVVLVLLPGGSFWMGAQKENPDGQNYDPQAATEEGPVHQVTLTPFFVSKYEMTQGQWLRIAGHNPSFYRAPGTQGMTLLDTLEQVSWLDCMRVLPRAGLTLPSEAQWEYACRAGTDTPWWTGRERETLLEQEAANLADQSAARAGAPWASIRDWPELDDGYSLHAPIGSHAANLFGLHEVIGNLWEWCLDGYDKSFYLRSPALDPVMPPASSYTRMYRGGGFAFTAADSRSARRGSNPPAAAEITLGVRPARPLGDR